MHRSKRVSDPCTLIAAADGFGLNWAELPREGKVGPITLRLVKDLPVRGRLINSEGKPVVGLEVEVRGLIGSLPNYLKALAVPGGVGGPGGLGGGAGGAGGGGGMMPGRPRAAGDANLLTGLNKALHVTATNKEGRFEITGLGAERVALVEGKSDTVVVAPVHDRHPEGLRPEETQPGAHLFLWPFLCARCHSSTADCGYSL